MAEAEKDNVGTTVDRLGDGKGTDAAGKDGAKGDDEATASSKGTIESGGSEDADLSQASGGSVD